MLIKILCGAIYLPPEGSRYSDIGTYDDIENDLMLLNPRNLYYTMPAGDFNARTRALHDCILYDYNLFHEINVDLAIADILEDEQTPESLGVPTMRSSKEDKPTKNFGRQLIDLCKNVSLYIFNGRSGTDQYCCDYTPSKNSIVDYVIGSPMLLSKVKDFAVDEFDPMFSDIHCGIEFSLNIACTATVPPLSKRFPDTKDNSTEQGYIWDSAKKQEFVNNINMQKVNRLYEEIENNNFDVNNIVETINNIWQSSAKSSFRKRTRNCPALVNSNNNNNSNNNLNVKHKWFNEKC